MSELKGFSTIEAIIASVLILMTMSISILIFSNVLVSNVSMLEHRAKLKLIEVSHEPLMSDNDIYIDENLSIHINSIQYEEHIDLKLFHLKATNSKHEELASLSLIRKIKE